MNPGKHYRFSLLTDKSRMFNIVIYNKGDNYMKEIDPVCGMEVDTGSGLRTDVRGNIYYFCSASDRDTFLKNPEKYIKKEARSSHSHA